MYLLKNKYCNSNAYKHFFFECRILYQTLAIMLAIWSLLTDVLNRDIVDVLHHFRRLSIQEICGLPRLLSAISPCIINCRRLYFSGCRIKCPRYWSLRVFIVVTNSGFLFICSNTVTLVMWSHQLIFNILRYIHISNTWIRLIDTLDKVQVSTP